MSRPFRPRPVLAKNMDIPDSSTGDNTDENQTQPLPTTESTIERQPEDEPEEDSDEPPGNPDDSEDDVLSQIGIDLLKQISRANRGGKAHYENKRFRSQQQSHAKLGDFQSSINS